MFQFYFRKSGKPAQMFNRLTGAPFSDTRTAIETFVDRFNGEGFKQREAKESIDLALFRNRMTDVDIVLRDVDTTKRHDSESDNWVTRWSVYNPNA